MQWDFGQGSLRQQEADKLLDIYQKSSSMETRFNENELEQVRHKLKTRGQSENKFTKIEKDRLDIFIRSDIGRQFISKLDTIQLNRKWEHVGEPLSKIKWLQDASQNEVIQIATITAKLFNQNEVRGNLLLKTLESHQMNTNQIDSWIKSRGVLGLNQNAQHAIINGYDHALKGARLISNLENSSSELGKIWRDEVHINKNPSLSNNFSYNQNAQLLDKIFRDPSNGQLLLDRLEQSIHKSLTIKGTDESSTIILNDQLGITVIDKDRNELTLTNGKWQNSLEHHHENKQPAPTHAEANQPLSPLAESLRGQIENLCRTEVGKLGFKWDGGMDNTVYALTAEALKNGFKQATHLALNDGTIDLGDLSADRNLLAALDSNIAANTPVENSLKNISVITQNQAQEESQKQTQQQTQQQIQTQTQSKAPHMSA